MAVGSFAMQDTAGQAGQRSDADLCVRLFVRRICGKRRIGQIRLVKRIVCCLHRGTRRRPRNCVVPSHRAAIRAYARAVPLGEETLQIRSAAVLLSPHFGAPAVHLRSPGRVRSRCPAVGRLEDHRAGRRAEDCSGCGGQSSAHGGLRLVRSLYSPEPVAIVGCIDWFSWPYHRCVHI